MCTPRRSTQFPSLRRPGRTRSRTVRDRKSTRLNSSHTVISYAVFCLKKKKNKHSRTTEFIYIVSVSNSTFYNVWTALNQTPKQDKSYMCSRRVHVRTSFYTSHPTECQ